VANEPVQVVTNPERLREPRTPSTPASAGTDFFAGDDVGFIRQKARLTDAIKQIEAVISSESWMASQGGLAHVRVSMRADAIAKSHRPQKALFVSHWTPHVATARVGEPIYAVTPRSLRYVLQRLESAPEDVRVRVDARTGELVPAPNRLRCEVSALESVELWTAADKRSFSAEEAVTWLSKPDAGGNYVIEFFPLASADRDLELTVSQRVSARTLQTELSALGIDARARRSLGATASREVSIRVLEETGPSQLSLGLLSEAVGSALVPSGSPSFDVDRHQAVLEVLDRSPLVRSVSLPPVPQQRHTRSAVAAETALPPLLEPPSGPVGRVGVIDGGVSEALEEWVEERWGQLAEADRELHHGTFISGLLIAAADMNPEFLSPQRTGCFISDVDLLPADPGATGVPFAKYYPNGVIDFFDEVEAAVHELRGRRQVRIFNFSMNFDSPRDDRSYGYAAQRVDEIARDQDVIFVVSGGNLGLIEQRAEWSNDDNRAVALLATESRTTIAEPAESLFNVSVSALNPPGLQDQRAYVLTRYSRRGPGLRGATKPDVGHVGGSGTLDPYRGHGLTSIDASGGLQTGAGTSYAAPLVARQLADLDALIDGEVSREVLLALLIHYCTLPADMRRDAVLPIAKHLAGFGIPMTAEEMLERPDSEIALVVRSTVLPGEQHTLDFSWPEALVRDGSCRGYARLTLVARPILAYEHGDERVRVNIDAKLMQQQAGGGYKSALSPTNGPARSKAARLERDLLNEELKWQVVKSFDARFRGRGSRSNWRLLVEYLTRAEESLPTAGVEFAAILTIADPTGIAPVFQQMRQQLGSLGVRTADIRTSLRARVANS
jgi:hypothetical protein